ncbi:nuclear transport factor 2 family protein [Biformimicrobium ophioploci]|uniref:Nuclear transport factor 2 family protein n=1 Tax=Biformimicrobium ophioploci TaxID=3036711 RepID=A0ABQ6M0U8_9GAMM|nr:nuclear transport factor 2 family protein [Microbulbifer sp. NKW57]GMG87931.1 nuclear transport factor 2 family protein [Microbulbifer sp. NKW57]
MQDFQQEKALVRQYLADMESASADAVESVMAGYAADDYRFYGVHPFNELSGVAEVAAKVWRPLKQALTRMQRRQDVFMAGESEIDGDRWVTSMGHFMGLLDGDWLGIPASRKLVMLRYAEFNCVKDGKISRTGFFVDIIGLMHQLGINPLPVQTGASFVYPGPRDHDGLLFDAHPPEEAARTLEVLNLMIDDLSELNRTANDRCPPELLARRWSEDMVWYGPAGIGATYTIERYQQQHQYPFREGLKDKVFNGHVCRFAEGNFACFFGWPNLSNTPTGGFLGLPGGEIRADMRVVDVYRREGGKLVENWVLIDIPYWLKQQGLDILERTSSIVNPA